MNYLDLKFNNSLNKTNYIIKKSRQIDYIYLKQISRSTIIISIESNRIKISSLLKSRSTNLIIQYKANIFFETLVTKDISTIIVKYSSIIKVYISHLYL